MIHFDRHSARFLFFKPGETVTVSVREVGPNSLAKITAIGDVAPTGDSRTSKVTVRQGSVCLVAVDAAFTGEPSELLANQNGVCISFTGSDDTLYVHDVRPRSGTQRWTYALAGARPDETWYFCSTPCEEWKPARNKPAWVKCPHCDGFIVATGPGT
jgi:hypothetical protein